MKTTDDIFERALKTFDDYHEKDPNLEEYKGQTFPKELLYAMRMTERLAQFSPEAGEAVKLAARSQHIGRWEIPREKYPMNKKGYLQWRNEEKIHHASIAAEILSACGYGSEMIEEVKFLLLKKELFSNANTQLLEDVVCLVFVEYYLEDFAAKHEDEKVIDILRKTMKKMSVEARNAAGGLNCSDRMKSLLVRSSGSLS